MSFTSIQSSLNFYTMQEASLTSELDDIMMSITSATRQTSDIAQQTSDKRNAIYSNQDASGSSDSSQYDSELNQVQDDYDLKLATITDWESELEVKKQNIETQLKEITSYKESFKSMLKQNVKNDFKYGQSSS